MNSLLRPTGDEALDRFMALLAARLQEGLWVKLILARPQSDEAGLRAGEQATEPPGLQAGVQRAVVRPLTLRGQPHLSFVVSYATRDVTQNLGLPEGLAQLRSWLGSGFRNAHLYTPSEETQLRFGKKGTGQLGTRRLASAAQTQPAAPPPPGLHDREKQRWLDIKRPFLVALGVTTEQHQLVPAMARKWKQINKFVEVFAHALARSDLAGRKTLRVVDFGAGKAYLTFAVHDWLRHSQGLEAQVTGVELRPDLVEQGNRVIAELGLQGLRMQSGDVRDWPGTGTHEATHESTDESMDGPMNVMIALHACDTATDHAIHLGLKAGADIILCSPCCHKQLRPQLLSPHPLRSVFQHGIHADQQAEMVTDSLRALLLEAQGYDTQVFEFVTLEHTRKNKMILAVKRKVHKPPESALAQVQELKRFFGIQEQCLETLLRA